MKKLISMFEVIEISQKEWQKPQYRAVEFGKVVVMIADKEHNQIAMTFQNGMPLPRLINVKANFDGELQQIIELLKQEKCEVVLLKQSLYK